MKIPSLLILLLTLTPFSMSCSRSPPPPVLQVFHAAVFEPVLRDLYPVAEKDLGIRIRAETGSSGNIIRRYVELGRPCDLILSADPLLFHSIGRGRLPWHIVWLSDEMVLAVGLRAPNPDLAERDWISALRTPGIRLARTDEILSPAGQYTLALWKRMEKRGYPGLADELRQKTFLVADDIGTIAARLKTGDVDYAFLFRSAALMHEIRFIALDPDINFSTEYEGTPPIRFAVTIPPDSAHPREAESLLRYLISGERVEWTDRGFRLLRPLFFGSRQDWKQFADIADYGGER